MKSIHCNLFKLKAFFIVLVFSLLVNCGNAKVDPPNYNFSLDELAVFSPGKKLEEIEAKYKQIETINEKGPKKIIRLNVKQLRYVFPVYVYIENGISQGYYARLPSYFLHDLFHQSLINRYRKQDLYQLKDNHAVYIWNNIKGTSLIYSGACTITCFPVFLAAMNRETYQQFGKKREGHLLLELDSFLKLN